MKIKRKTYIKRVFTNLYLNEIITLIVVVPFIIIALLVGLCAYGLINVHDLAIWLSNFVKIVFEIIKVIFVVALMIGIIYWIYLFCRKIIAFIRQLNLPLTKEEMIKNNIDSVSDYSTFLNKYLYGQEMREQPYIYNILTCYFLQKKELQYYDLNEVFKCSKKIDFNNYNEIDFNEIIKIKDAVLFCSLVDNICAYSCYEYNCYLDYRYHFILQQMLHWCNGRNTRQMLIDYLDNKIVLFYDYNHEFKQTLIENKDKLGAIEEKISLFVKGEISFLTENEYKEACAVIKLSKTKQDDFEKKYMLDSSMHFRIYNKNQKKFDLNTYMEMSRHGYM